MSHVIDLDNLVVLEMCDVCACEPTERRHFDADDFPVRYCGFHEDHGFDLPCPECGDHA